MRTAKSLISLGRAQVDLSFVGRPGHFVGFCHAAAHIVFKQ